MGLEVLEHDQTGVDLQLTGQKRREVPWSSLRVGRAERLYVEKATPRGRPWILTPCRGYCVPDTFSYCDDDFSLGVSFLEIPEGFGNLA